MNRTLSILLLGAVVVIAACGNDKTAAPATSTTAAASAASAASTPTDDAATSTAADDSTAESSATSTPAATGSDPAVTAASTVPIPTAPPADCESEPDLANYEIEIPVAVRPCDLPTELVSTTVIEGTGEAAKAGDTVYVHYVGIRSKTGEVFDASYMRGTPFELKLGAGRVITGWDEGLIGITTGEVRRLDIPAAMAYGASPPGPPIEPDDPLTFIVTAVGIVPPTTIDDAPLDVQVPESTEATETTVDVRIKGKGAAVPAGGTAIAHVMLVRGDDLSIVFNSWETSAPWSINTEENETLPGMSKGLTGAHIGDRLVITMPPAEAFGEEGVPELELPGDVDVIAVVDVIGAY